MWAAVQSGEAEATPALLQPLLLLAYCDLKHFKYRYWFAFPALQPPQPFTLAAQPTSVLDSLGEATGDAVAAACSAHAAAGSGAPAWLVSVGADGEVVTAPLTDWARLQQQPGAAVCLAAADSSNQPANPGWPLRNLLLLAAAQWGCRELPVLCLRERHGRYCAAASLALSVVLPELPPGYSPAAVGGWEPNERGKLGVRTADLGPTMDPARWVGWRCLRPLRAGLGRPDGMALGASWARRRPPTPRPAASCLPLLLPPGWQRRLWI